MSWRPRLRHLPYLYSSDWVSANTAAWRRVLGGLRGAPGLRYLEIGAFQGRSANWFLGEILTHPDSNATLVEPFLYSPRWVCEWNLRLAGHRRRVTVLQGLSGDVLPRLGAAQFDVVYVDGSHRAADVERDAAGAWRVLRPGGFLLFDDYLWGAGEKPPEDRPQPAIDAFLAAHAGECAVLEQGWQVIVRRAGG